MSRWSRSAIALPLRFGRSGGSTVEVRLDLDVVIDADPAQPPFGKGIGLAGQRLEVRPIEFLEQRTSGDAKTADRSLLVELVQQLTDRRIEFGQAVKAAMAQPAQEPARSTISTATSTFALSRGRRGRAGRTAVS